MAAATMSSRLAVLGVLTACSTSPVVQNEAGSDAASEAASDAAQEAAVVVCSTPGAACAGGGACFFAVGNCAATTGVCSDNSSCAAAPTETVCHCDGTMTAVPQCGPGGYALVKAANYGPCVSDGGSD